MLNVMLARNAVADFVLLVIAARMPIAVVGWFVSAICAVHVPAMLSVAVGNAAVVLAWLVTAARMPIALAVRFVSATSARIALLMLNAQVARNAVVALVSLAIAAR